METEKTKTIINRDQVMTGLEYLTISRMLDGAIELQSGLLDEPTGCYADTIANVSAILDGIAMIIKKTKSWTVEALDGRVLITDMGVIAELRV